MITDVSKYSADQLEAIDDLLESIVQNSIICHSCAFRAKCCYAIICLQDNYANYRLDPCLAERNDIIAFNRNDLLKS